MKRTNLMWLKRLMAMCALLTLLSTAGFAQDAVPDTSQREGVADTHSEQSDEHRDEPRRILWIIPNYRSSPTLKDYHPLTPKQKLTIAIQDSLDPGTFALAALFGAYGELTAESPTFGHGARAYPRYYVSSLTDFVVGNFMTESIYPTLLRHDPRYFRRGTGSGWNRLGYAVGQIVWTHTDAGGSAFNVSEIAGNATAVAIGNAYYPDNRTVSSNVSKLGIQIGVDAVANILKEFAPELEQLLSRHSASRR
jgi:hypothetical protein